MKKLKIYMRRCRISGTFVLLGLFVILLFINVRIFSSQINTQDMDQVIVWKEETLETLVREKLKMPDGDITPGDLRDIRVLNFSGLQLETVEDLAFFPNVYYLDLSHNQIKDISPLWNLNLWYLNLEDNQLTSLKGIYHLNMLHGIDISNNPIRDIRNLLSLDSLYELTVTPSNLSNENPLRWLKHLDYLELTQQLKDERILNDLNHLKRLAVAGEITSFSDSSDTQSAEERMILPEYAWGSRATDGIRQRIGSMTWTPYHEEGMIPYLLKQDLYMELNDRKGGNEYQNPFFQKIGAVLNEHPLIFAWVLMLTLICAGAVYIWFDCKKQKRCDAFAKRTHFGAYLTDDVMTCLGDAGERYLDNFSRVRAGKPVLHLWALLFGELWFAYRLMWKEALGIMMLHIIGIRLFYQAAIYNLGEIGGTYVWGWVKVGLRVFYVLLIVFSADPLYWRHVRAVLNRNGCEYRKAAKEVEENPALKNAGGVSVLNVILMAGVSSFLSLLGAWMNQMI